MNSLVNPLKSLVCAVGREKHLKPARELSSLHPKVEKKGIKFIETKLTHSVVLYKRSTRAQSQRR